MNHFSRLPDEVVEIIVEHLAFDYRAIQSFSRTHRRIFTLIYRSLDQHLWRALFLRRYDDPRLIDRFSLVPFDQQNWRSHFQGRVVAVDFLAHLHASLPNIRGQQEQRLIWIIGSILQSSAPTIPFLHIHQHPIHDHGETSFVDAYRSAPLVVPFPGEGPRSKNIEELSDVITKDIICSMYLSLLSPTTTSMRGTARLCTFVGWNSGEMNSSYTETISLARRRVFDMSYPRKRTLYGPWQRQRQPHGQHPQTLTIYEYKPDWPQVAALRIVAEDMLWLHPDCYAVLTNLYSLRPGTLSVDTLPPEERQPDISGSKPCRDWAGVEGVWRRLVVWIDYDALLLYNDDDLYDDDVLAVAQTHGIFPVRMRIVSARDDPDAPPGFPTLDIEGEIGGESWVDNDTDHNLDIRFMKGSVSMLKDGTVRWSLVSYVDVTDSEGQWLSEGIQLGGIGSMAGILGMWTGANHLRDDPVGAWWQWRVA
ncbi:hypothetical protein K474DRAFT_1672241 [Panus rudis PR-1116 ss-1]|nr:hypothetical protein K474DRAFT_1672241 [Panus rudis PR-1116 ss-1]